MRSFLFVPADSEKKLAKGAGAGADALIVDLEDSVALSNKEAARKSAVAYLKTADRTGPKLVLRINALDTPFWEADLEAVVPAKPDMIVVPKTISGACVKKVGDRIDRLGGGDIGIGCVATETAASLFTLGTYAGSHPRLAFLTWGAEDLAAALGARDNKDEQGNYTGPYRLARTLTLLGAVAAGVAPIDGIYKDFRDEAGLEAEARAAIRDGFTGKMAIHPAQVAIINAVFTPGEADLAHARAVIEAFEKAGDVGVVALDGVMLDIPHLKQAKALLSRAAKAN
ncbi:CoA ester lyase [Parvibaculum sp.]|uniref:HpcH/HpaI aldolase/citrate lyase family protein n=1 Tax=Parvibaculum sp. TaxID=2024848 RepID=UPI001DBA0D23|nr:CoA ester lyase [Parvibaculum sp.]MBX3488307.1 CoA ester lyase [Parvibaculum sp.]MCW5727715.1 CoA ester lyase [Parvibaculum sp.]